MEKRQLNNMSDRLKIVRPFIHLPIPVWSTLALTAIIAWSPVVVGAEFQISLEGGSVITVHVDQETFRWTNVLENGEMIKEQIKFSQIEQLVLSDSPASEQVAEIRRLLSVLESPDYLERQMAEEKLSDPEIAGSFQSMIKAQVEHSNFEVRHRVGRILEKLGSADVDATHGEFDLLILKDGTRKEGDAGEFRLDCSYRNRNLSLARKDLNFVSVPVALAAVKSVNAEVQVEMFHNHEGGFLQPGQTMVDFDLAPNGADIARNTDVTEMFTPLGLRLGTEQVGYVGISGYGFKFALPPKSNSICVFETIGTYSKRFKGVMEISFCLPNRKSVPAGVNEFGMFMARVNHSRDFIVEAYNADGQILATVESTDQACAFAGVKSNEPIAKLRVLSNPYLFRLDRNIDEDYAVDNIYFSKPVPITTSPEEGKAVLRLKNGDLIQGTEISIIDPDSISIEMDAGDPITVGRTELQSIQFNVVQPKGNGNGKENKWTAMLKDRSTLFVKPGETFVCTSFPNLKFKPDELTGFWSSRNPTRFPEATDFSAGNRVMVFPTCRIATDQIEFLKTGYRWKKSAKKIQQPLQTKDKKDDEDPTPDVNSVEYATTWPENIPSIWTNPPRTQTAGTGRLKLVDGQQLVLGADRGFSLTKLDKHSVTVSIADMETKIPIEEIASIDFPQAEGRSED
jgi:hypothetical protein